MQARNLIEVREKAPKMRKSKRKQVLRETSKDLRYKSPFYKGELPAWL